MDPATGKPLYQPQTCRAPKFARNPDGAPIIALNVRARGRAHALSLSARKSLSLQTVPQPALLTRLTLGLHVAPLPAGQPIGEYLYAIQSERQEKLAAVVSTTQQRATAEAASTYVNRRSEVGCSGGVC